MKNNKIGKCKIIQVIFNIWICLLTLFFILCLFGFLLINQMTSNPASVRNLNIYKKVYNLVKNENFTEGKVGFDDLLYLKAQDDEIYTITLDDKVKNYRRFFHEIRKNEENEIVMKKYNGILGNDVEIIFSDNLYFDQTKYISIDKVDENIFLCELNEFYHSEPISISAETEDTGK